MKQRRLGATGPLTSSLGLGCMGMSEFYGETNDADSLRTLEKALALGITHFDSADTYGLGHNESLLGRFIAQGGSTRRQQMVIVTKFGIVRRPASTNGASTTPPPTFEKPARLRCAGWVWIASTSITATAAIRPFPSRKWWASWVTW